MKQRRRWIWWVLGGLGAIILGLVVVGMALSEKLPEGESGPEADALAQKMMTAVNKTAWDSTGAISWVFNGSAGHQHLWDKKRHFAKVVWADYEVLVDINQKTGVALENGVALKGEKAAKLVDKAWKFWVNDAFWLNPVVKAFDDGVSREVVILEDGSKGVKITFSSGGATPGDSYLWLLDQEGRPTGWKMWVSIIPIGGIFTSWEGWQQLSTGAWVSTSHRNGKLELKIEEVRGATNLAELVPGEDPFAALENQPS
jgi:hypothetical protein